MKKKLSFIIFLVVAVSICTLTAFAGCKKDGESYADLVALRVNNRMAEWSDIGYNFKYEGMGELNVTVPYTNYLQINDLITSPQAEASVYEDEACTNAVQDKEKIYTDGNKTLYIKVVNKKQSHLYRINITVKQDNLPDGDISAKTYDNRGGHIYIPADAKTVTVDGQEYAVIRNFEEFYTKLENSNAILACNIMRGSVPLKKLQYIFDGNGYDLTETVAGSHMFNEIEENAVAKNFNLVMSGELSDDGYFEEMIRDKKSYICVDNKGVIDNVCCNLNVRDYEPGGIYIGMQQGNYYAHEISMYSQINTGKITNCLNKGKFTCAKTDYIIRYGVFSVNGSGGTYTNCVNTGDIENGSTVNDDKVVNGSYILAPYGNGKEVTAGIYNLGKLEVKKGKKERGYEGYFGVAIDTVGTEAYYPDFSTSRNYTR